MKEKKKLWKMVTNGKNSEKLRNRWTIVKNCEKCKKNDENFLFFYFIVTNWDIGENGDFFFKRWKTVKNGQYSGNFTNDCDLAQSSADTWHSTPDSQILHTAQYRLFLNH